MTISNTLKISSSVLLLLFLAFSTQAELPQQRKLELQHLLKHDCGSCHGMTLKGGLGPALLVENLEDKSDEFLLITIQQGRPGTPMPPWNTLLSEEDIRWLVQLLRNPSAIEPLQVMNVEEQYDE